jgi:hypothetical protein
MYPDIDMEDIEKLRDEVILLRVVNNNLRVQNEEKDTRIKELEDKLDLIYEESLEYDI